MQPLSLIIPGTYWDCWVYRGWLYLWDLDNSLRIYDLDSVVESLADDRTRLPLTCAFSQGDYLYGPRWQVVFSDPDVGPIVRQKFLALAEQPFTLSSRELAKFLIGQFDSPFQQLHDDCDIYRNNFFALTSEGLFKAEARRSSGRRAVSAHSEKLWDAPGVSLTASGNNLAIAAGSDGLFEFPLSNRHGEQVGGWPSERARQVSKRHTSFANWAFSSLYGSSDVESGYLLAYSWEKTEGRPDRSRTFTRQVDESEIFGKHGLSWARAEKMYCLHGSTLRAVRFTQKYVAHPEKGSPFQRLGEQRIPPRLGPALSAGVAMFGTVLEFENAVVVLQSDGEIYSFPGPAIRWRVFPRSRRYENQLHVLTENALVILSFNHDYYVDQRKKILGIAWTDDAPFIRGRV